ncbi:unnamed protein product [Sphagnum jensenii]|uniref:F-box domain-containing protein n=1 Tax=Sphagnum jensenii TaxID=128206 RepID=A0ABP1AYG7_9BRYO
MEGPITTDKVSQHLVQEMGDTDDDEEPLNGSLWSKLPDEVLDQVLAWLPLTAFFRMHCVCKKWKEIISSPSFLETYSRVPFQTAFFLHLIRVNGVLMAACHDPSVNRWQRLPLDSVPINAYIHGGAGGLLCCQRVVNAFLVLSICNPLTKCWRDLPPMPRLNTATCFVRMVADKTSNTYKVIRVAQLQPLPPVRHNGARIELCTEVYESRCDMWKAVTNTPSDLRFIQGCSMSNGALQCRTSTTRRMMTYDLEQEAWAELFTQNLDSILDSKLVDCAGKPFLVTRVWKGGLVESIDIWGQKPRRSVCNSRVSDTTILEHEEEASSLLNIEWEEVDRMPHDLFQEWSSSAGLFYHVGVGNSIYSTCLARGATKLVTYNLCQKKWQLVVGCPVSHINTYLGGFEFCPRLDAAV